MASLLASVLPRVDVFDDPFRRAQRFGKTFFEILEIELGHQRFRRNAFEARDVLHQRAKRRYRGRHELRDRLAVCAGLDVSLAKVYDMAARLHFTRAPQFLLRHENLGEEVYPGDEAASGHDFAELERERV